MNPSPEPSSSVSEEPEQVAASAAAAIPPWTPDFDIQSFDVAAVFREATAQKKSAYKVLKAAGYPVAKFISQDVLTFKAAEDGKRIANVTLTASSDAEDLAGDDFAESAINQMRAQMKGMSVFLNHSYDLPEDLFGTVEETIIERREVFNPVTGETKKTLCLDLEIRPVTEDENPRGVRVYNMIRKGQRKLGSSVTVLVVKAKKKENGGKHITDVFTIEDSIVGIPCNQTAWVHTSAKSLAPEGKFMDKKETSSQPPAATAAPTEATPATPTAPAVEQTRENEQSAKAMFADVLHERQNNFWMFVDSLSTVVSRLRREAKGKDAPGQAALVTEFSTSLAEFTEQMSAWMSEEIAEAAAQDRSTDYYWDYYSALGRLTGVLHKAGARNSQADLELLQRAHDCMKELGAACGASTEAAGDEAQKQASVATLTEATSKAATLETKIAALETEKAQLETTNAELQQQLTTVQEEKGLLEASSLSMLAVLKAIGHQPLPRAGQASVSHVRQGS